MRRAALVAAVAAAAILAFPAVAQACNGWSEPDMETQLMCPTCHQVLAYSQSSIATHIRTFLLHNCSAGWTSSRIKNTLVAQFGPEILASPPKHGFDLLAWLIPAAALLGGIGVASVLAMRWRGRRGPPPPPPPAIDEKTSARIDAELAAQE